MRCIGVGRGSQSRFGLHKEAAILDPRTSGRCAAFGCPFLALSKTEIILGCFPRVLWWNHLNSLLPDLVG
jgi:hypothetical protein